MRRATACLLLLAILGLAAGCGSDSSKDDAAAAAAARARAKAARQARLVAAGRGVFIRHCAECHTIEGRVAHPTFIESPIPDLDEVKPEVRYVEDRVDRGGFDMPGFGGQLSRGDFDAVVAYVAGVAGTRVKLSTNDPVVLSEGEQLFRDNCQRCHSIDGRRANGRFVYPGTDFNLVKPSEKLIVKQVTRGIVEEMPSFRDRLSPAQIRAVAVYVTATAGE